jgi:methionine synthase II (cobalamin-independent)
MAARFNADNLGSFLRPPYLLEAILKRVLRELPPAPDGGGSAAPGFSRR